MLCEASAMPLERLADGGDWRLCEALLTLHAIADEACAGLFVALDRSDGQGCLYRARGRELLVRTGTLARIPPQLLRVLPRIRTPPTGRACFSRYACVHDSGFETAWYKIPARHPGTDPQADHVEMLLLPWPLRVRSSDFRAVPGSVQRLAKEPFGFFEFVPEERLDLDLLDRVLIAALDEVESVDVVMLPESAIDGHCRTIPTTQPGDRVDRPGTRGDHAPRRHAVIRRFTRFRPRTSHRRTATRQTGSPSDAIHARTTAQSTDKRRRLAVRRAIAVIWTCPGNFGTGLKGPLPVASYSRDFLTMNYYTRISDALRLRALLFEPDSGAELNQVLDRYYAPDYTHRTDGKTLDRDEFAEMVARVRSQVAEGAVTVLDELRDGSAYAERHVFHIRLKNGATQDREVATFGTFAEDGRFRHLNETGFDLDPAER